MNKENDISNYGNEPFYEEQTENFERPIRFEDDNQSNSEERTDIPLDMSSTRFNVPLSSDSGQNPRHIPAETKLKYHKLISNGPVWLNFFHMIILFACLMLIIKTADQVSSKCDNFWLDVFCASIILMVFCILVISVCIFEQYRKVFLLITSIVSFALSINCFILLGSESKNEFCDVGFCGELDKYGEVIKQWAIAPNQICDRAHNQYVSSHNADYLKFISNYARVTFLAYCSNNQCNPAFYSYDFSTFQNIMIFSGCYFIIYGVMLLIHYRRILKYQEQYMN